MVGFDLTTLKSSQAEQNRILSSDSILSESLSFGEKKQHIVISPGKKALWKVFKDFANS
jgi:hypothetical protein